MVNGFERVYLDKLRLACEVLVDASEEFDHTDGLAVEVFGFKDRIERMLLQAAIPGQTPVSDGT